MCWLSNSTLQQCWFRNWTRQKWEVEIQLIELNVWSSNNLIIIILDFRSHICKKWLLVSINKAHLHLNIQFTFSNLADVLIRSNLLLMNTHQGKPVPYSHVVWRTEGLTTNYVISAQPLCIKCIYRWGNGQTLKHLRLVWNVLHKI